MSQASQTSVRQDPLKPVYHRQALLPSLHLDLLRSHSTALMVIDLQYLDAAPGHGVFKDVERCGVPPQAQEYYFNSLSERVLPNIQRLLRAFRLYKLEVIHTRIQSLTRDGRDRSNGHKRLDLLAPPGSKDAEFLPEVAPEGDEIVINKTASGVFSSTNLHYVLKNIGIEALYVVGVYTNECVETTVRDACDLGYRVTVVEDCCTTVTPELHKASLTTLKDRYARVLSTSEAIQEIERHLSREQL